MERSGFLLEHLRTLSLHKFKRVLQEVCVRFPGGGVLTLWPNKGSGLFEGPAKDYQRAQFREITLPLGGILVVRR